MEGVKRKSFQGVFNIIRFNWHFYVVASLVMTCLALFKHYFSDAIGGAFFVIAFILIFFSTFISLAVSYYVYDLSHLYTLSWLDLQINSSSQLVNINAGFDETSILLSKKYSGSPLSVFDFYDPIKHTEVSIERARKAYPSYPGTINISTSQIPLSPNSADYIFLLLAAHEIRNTDERISFFIQIREGLKENGKVVVVEHLRDLSNFMAYNFGFFHFFSKKEWQKTFNSSGLCILKEIKITPFISTFILQKNGTTS